MEIRYDPEHKGLGYHSCRNCKRVFVSGLNPSHEDNCPDKGEGWNVAVYTFGPSESNEIKEQRKNSKNSGPNKSIVKTILQNIG